MPTTSSSTSTPLFTWNEFEPLLRALTVPNYDDGKAWTRTDRLQAIHSQLAPTDYAPLHQGPLAWIYARRGFDPRAPFMLLSTHVDSIYGEHFLADAPWAPEEDELGTFDNSITNAVSVELMRRGALPPQTLVAFTGDEERTSGGAFEVMRVLGRRRMRPRLDLLLVLDITGEAPGPHPCTLENVFVRRTRPDPRLHYFRSRRALAERLRGLLGFEAATIFDAAGDEAWDYHDYDLNCLTFCFPSRPHPENAGTDDGHWMHDARGLLIRREHASGYAAALARVCGNFLGQ